MIGRSIRQPHCFRSPVLGNRLRLRASEGPSKPPGPTAIVRIGKTVFPVPLDQPVPIRTGSTAQPILDLENPEAADSEGLLVCTTNAGGRRCFLVQPSPDGKLRVNGLEVQGTFQLRPGDRLATDDHPTKMRVRFGPRRMGLKLFATALVSLCGSLPLIHWIADRNFERRFGERITQLHTDSPVDPFLDILKETNPAMLMVFHEFSFAAYGQKQTAQAWGSAFFFTPQGHIGTNRHVVQPWVLDPQMRELIEMGVMDIPTTERLIFFPFGSRVFDEKGKINETAGYSVANGSLLQDSHGGPMILTPASEEGADVAVLQAFLGDGMTVPYARLAPTSVTVASLDTLLLNGYPSGFAALDQDGVARTSPNPVIVRTNGSRMIATAGALVHGNSGGVALAKDGRVVGIPTAILQEGHGMVTPVEKLFEIAPPEVHNFYHTKRVN